MKSKDIFGEKDICEIFGLDAEDIVRLCYEVVLEQVDEKFHLISEICKPEEDNKESWVNTVYLVSSVDRICIDIIQTYGDRIYLYKDGPWTSSVVQVLKEMSFLHDEDLCFENLSNKQVRSIVEGHFSLEPS